MEAKTDASNFRLSRKSAENSAKKYAPSFEVIHGVQRNDPLPPETPPIVQRKSCKVSLHLFHASYITYNLYIKLICQKCHTFIIKFAVLF